MILALLELQLLLPYPTSQTINAVGELLMLRVLVQGFAKFALRTYSVKAEPPSCHRQVCLSDGLKGCVQRIGA